MLINDSQSSSSTASDSIGRPDLTVLPGAATQNTSPSSEELFSWRKPKSLQLAMQIGLSLAVVLFCGGQIIVHDLKNKDVSLYWGGIVGILAWWMPSPTNSNSSKSEAKPS